MSNIACDQQQSNQLVVLIYPTDVSLVLSLDIQALSLHVSQQLQQ